MFKCHFCKETTAPRILCKKVALYSRFFHHPMRSKAMVRKVIKNGRKKKEYITDPGGSGTQIVYEVNACGKCAAEQERLQKDRSGASTVPVVVFVPKLAPSVINPEPPPLDKRPPRLRREHKERK